MFVWVKNGLGMGNYWRITHEILLTAAKGGVTFSDHSQRSWEQYVRGKHSRKPHAVAEKIEHTSPGPYIELFARQTRPNWTVWGDEIERDLFNEQLFK